MKKRWQGRILTGWALIAAVAGPVRGVAQDKALTPEELEFFESKIRPVLIEHCHKCHSADKDAKIKGGLQLDSKAGLLKGGSTGPAVIPGNSERSLLVKAVRYTDSNLQMPPKEKLPDSVVADLESWVRMGAPDPRFGKQAGVLKTDEDRDKAKKHWAFQPIQQPKIPALKNELKSWVRNDIDRFLLAKLEEKGLFPSPLADKGTLVRRAYFDLLGLPPTPKEAEEFMADESADAWPKLIDKLLASSHYGERWARYWLDVARYADTRGAANNNRMADNRLLHAFTFRDWVVDSLNTDLPYDQFLKYQIGADVIPGTDNKHLAALGYLTLNRSVNNREELIDDRIDVVTRGMMSLSVYCARCHDHKFDPIPTKDYYSLYGVFDSTVDARDKPVLEKADDTPLYRDYVQKKAGIEAELEVFRNTTHGKYVGEAKARTQDYLLMVNVLNTTTNYSLGNRADQQRFEDATKLQFEIAGPWRTYVNARASRANDTIFKPWADYTKLKPAEFATKSKELAADYWKNNQAAKGLNPIVAKVFSTPASDIRVVAERYTRLFFDAEKAWVSASTADSKKKKEDDSATLKRLPDAAMEELRQVFYANNSPVNIPYDRLARQDNNRIQNMERPFQDRLDALEVSHPGAPTRAMALSDSSNPKNAQVLIKGERNNRGPEVPRQFIEVLNPGRKPFTKGSGRQELAQEIGSKNNPLTARVLVNRTWMNHFGGALVRTPTDFGIRADDPTHPELLEHLAWWVMENGWSQKKLHKYIMTSAAYMQSSEDRPKPLLQDPANLFGWKMNRRRLEFEAFRDALLLVGGKLNPALGGVPVDLINENNRLGYKYDPYRRTIYGYIDRGNLASVFRTFDMANPEATAGMRFNSTVPQQALYMMNSPFIADLARAMVNRPDVKGKVDEEQRIETLYDICFQRPPTPLETKISVRYLEEQSGVKSVAAAQPMWQHGYGQYNPRSRATTFFRLPSFTENNRTYDGGMKIPGIRLDANGGQAGAVAVIRRWTSPIDGPVTIDGQLGHVSRTGDGVNAYILHSRSGQLTNLTASYKRVDAKIARVDVRKGDTIDFIVDNGGKGNALGDTFTWAPSIRPVGATTAPASPAMTAMTAMAGAGAPAAGMAGGMAASNDWSLARAFTAGPPAAAQKPLEAWEKFAQVLLLSNEMTFVD